MSEFKYQFFWRPVLDPQDLPHRGTELLFQVADEDEDGGPDLLYIDYLEGDDDNNLSLSYSSVEADYIVAWAELPPIYKREQA